MNDYRMAVQSWLMANPLRQWRTDHQLTLRDVGAAIGTGYHTIYRWESGMAFPKESQYLRKENNHEPHRPGRAG